MLVALIPGADAVGAGDAVGADELEAEEDDDDEVLDDFFEELLQAAPSMATVARTPATRQAGWEVRWLTNVDVSFDVAVRTVATTGWMPG
jgi:hypothetical protein